MSISSGGEDTPPLKTAEEAKPNHRLTWAKYESKVVQIFTQKVKFGIPLSPGKRERNCQVRAPFAALFRFATKWVT